RVLRSHCVALLKRGAKRRKQAVILDQLEARRVNNVKNERETPKSDRAAAEGRAVRRIHLVRSARRYNLGASKASRVVRVKQTTLNGSRIGRDLPNDRRRTTLIGIWNWRGTGNRPRNIENIWAGNPRLRKCYRRLNCERAAGRGIQVGLDHQASIRRIQGDAHLQASRRGIKRERASSVRLNGVAAAAELHQLRQAPRVGHVFQCRRNIAIAIRRETADARDECAEIGCCVGAAHGESVGSFEARVGEIADGRRRNGRSAVAAARGGKERHCGREKKSQALHRAPASDLPALAAGRSGKPRVLRSVSVWLPFWIMRAKN